VSRFLSLRILAAAAALAVSSRAGLAQTVGHWVSIGPEGGYIQALAVDPGTPSTIYAGCTTGIFKSFDGGASWSPAGLGGPNVFALAIDPVRTSTLYAGTGKGVFKSSDGGVRWTLANTGLTSTVVLSLAVDPQTPATVYAGTNGGVFKSTDGAATWSAASGAVGTQRVVALAINPASPSTLYAAVVTGSVYRSSDGAASWTAASNGLPTSLPASKIYCLAIDPKSPSTIYLGTYSGTFKSTDGAASWTAAGGQAIPFLSMAIDPVTPSTVYGGDGGQIYKSTDGVATWKAVYCCLNVWALAVNPKTPSTVYAGTQSLSSPGGFWKSTNSGVAGSWKNSNSGLTPAKIFSLAVDPAAPSTVYAGTNLGLFKSADLGTSWSQLPTGSGGIEVWAVAVIPGSSAILAGTDSAGFRSTDGGVTWMQGAPPAPIPYAYVIDPNSPSTVWAVGGAGPSLDQLNGAISQSTDGGQTWPTYYVGDTGTFPPVFNAAVVNPPSSTSPLIFGTDAGIWGTRVGNHGGLHLITNGALASRVVFALAEDPVSRSIIYAGTDGGLFKSTDGGMSFGTQVTNGLTATGIYALLFDPSSASTLYAGTNSGVFKSTDGGASWANIGLTNLVVESLSLGPGPSGAFYAGTNGFGAYILSTELERRMPIIRVGGHEPLEPPTELSKQASPSRNLVWTPPDNLTPSDAVTYKLWITGGTSCANGCLYHPAAPSWYTMGSEIGAGSYSWQLQAVSATRHYSPPVNGPPFTMP
jgi:photosystem II stability/assembly factor-like uncharacterized protein